MPDLSFWAESRWNRPVVRAYGYRSTAYTTGLHRGQDAPAGDWGARPIPAIRPGRVVQTYRTTALGWIVVVDAGQGVGPYRFDCYCHLAQQDAASLGATLRAGDTVGRAAREWEAPGIVGVTWLGMHIHLVISTVARGGDSVYAPTTDPRPIIRAALAAPADSGATPFEPETSEEDDMPINFRSTTGGVSYSMVPGICITRHENEIAAALTLEFVTGKKYPGAGATPEQRKALGERQLRDEEILVILAKFGFWSASGSVNNLPAVGETLWSDAIRALRGDTAEIKTRLRGTFPENAGEDMLQIIWHKVKGGAVGGAVDVAAIAEAVNDEEDRRDRERLGAE